MERRTLNPIGDDPDGRCGGRAPASACAPTLCGAIPLPNHDQPIDASRLSSVRCTARSFDLSHIERHHGYSIHGSDRAFPFAMESIWPNGCHVCDHRGKANAPLVSRTATHYRGHGRKHPHASDPMIEWDDGNFQSPSLPYPGQEAWPSWENPSFLSTWSLP